MPGFLFHIGATAVCPHSGQITTISTNARVRVNGQPVATMSDVFLIAGCVFTVVDPQPCVKVQWLSPATRVRVNGRPVILQTSPALCQNVEQLPQGAPIVVVAQKRVRGM
jgi:uncharacterized Zn-binding protein involved in type VI secretion